MPETERPEVGLLQRSGLFPSVTLLAPGPSWIPADQQGLLLQRWVNLGPWLCRPDPSPQRRSHWAVWCKWGRGTPGQLGLCSLQWATVKPKGNCVNQRPPGPVLPNGAKPDGTQNLRGRFGGTTQLLSCLLNYPLTQFQGWPPTVAAGEHHKQGSSQPRVCCRPSPQAL